MMAFFLLISTHAQPVVDCARSLPFFPDTGWTYVEGLDINRFENRRAISGMWDLNPTFPVFIIKSTGKGMSKNVVDNIFQSFFQPNQPVSVPDWV